MPETPVRRRLRTTQRLSSTASPLHSHGLPHNILDEVFGIIREDTRFRKQDLFSASLVSKSWEDASRRHRFRTIILCMDKDSKNYTVERFSKCKHFGVVKEYIKKLVLGWDSMLGDVKADFLDILPMFPEVSELVLKGHLKDRVSPKPPTAANTLHIRKLTIDGRWRNVGNEYHEPTAFCDVLGLFGALDELTLKSIRFRGDDNEDRQEEEEIWTDATFPRIASLVMCCSSRLLRKILQSTSVSRRVKTATFMREEVVRPNPSGLIHSMSALTHLTISLQVLESTSGENPLDLSKLQTLRSLTLEGYLGAQQKGFPSSWLAAAELFSTLKRDSNPRLSYIRLNLTISPDGEYDGSRIVSYFKQQKYAIARIDELLGRVAQSGSLRRVECRLHRFLGSYLPAYRLFPLYFPRLVIHGVLYIPRLAMIL